MPSPTRPSSGASLVASLAIGTRKAIAATASASSQFLTQNVTSVSVAIAVTTAAARPGPIALPTSTQLTSFTIARIFAAPSCAFGSANSNAAAMPLPIARADDCPIDGSESLLQPVGEASGLRPNLADQSIAPMAVRSVSKRREAIVLTVSSTTWNFAPTPSASPKLRQELPRSPSRPSRARAAARRRPARRCSRIGRR